MTRHRARISPWRFVKAFYYGVRESGDPKAWSRYHVYELVVTYNAGRRAAVVIYVVALLATIAAAILLAHHFLTPPDFTPMQLPTVMGPR